MFKIARILFLYLPQFFVCCESKDKVARSVDTEFHFKVTQVGSTGWGYQIFDGQKVIIDQQFIPAVQSYHQFKTSAQAEAVARLVIHKLRTKPQDRPTVSIQDLDSLQIQL